MNEKKKKKKKKTNYLLISMHTLKSICLFFPCAYPFDIIFVFDNFHEVSKTNMVRSMFAIDDEINKYEGELDSNSHYRKNMFRSSLVIICILMTLMIGLIDGKVRIRNRRQQILSTRKPVSIKICGLALVRMLDMVCQQAKQLLMKKLRISTYEKRQMNFDDDPFTQTLWIKDYARRD
jgi:hypothetical protein